MVTIQEVADSELTIKRLLRRENTAEYFRENGWTKDPAEAKCFLDMIEVAETCARCGLDHVEVILRVDAQACDFFCTAVR
jgi:hypothetical protein